MVQTFDARWRCIVRVAWCLTKSRSGRWRRWHGTILHQGQGGRWTLKNLGVAYDSYRGTARGIMPKEFCKACRLQTSITCTVKTYGEESCIMLVKYWCDKMKFLYDVWSRAGGSAVNWADELRHYVEPPAIVTLFNSSTTAVLRNRIKSIRTSIPKQ